MENLTFDTLNAAWNRVRQYDGWQLRTLLSGLRDPSRVIMQRIAETPDAITIMFSGFDEALDNPEQDAPVMKRFILQWMQRFAQAQIARGDASTFILRVTKPVSTPPQQPAQREAARPDVSRSLVHISSVRKLPNGHH